MRGNSNSGSARFNLSSAQIAELSGRFRRFAELECRNSSPLYENVSLGISRDEDLLRLAANSSHRPIPNLFLATVHYLLLKEASRSPLSAFYADMEPNVDKRTDPMPRFREFCLENSDAIKEILRTRLVQTNEVQRCAFLLPALQFVSSKTAKPLALVEIGAAAGLNLLWDKYSYDYGNGTIYGDRSSRVRIDCELRGKLTPPFSRELPQTTFRVGIDLNPLDVNNEDDVLWLKALIWPEHSNRTQLLEAAIKETRNHQSKLIKGDALNSLPNALEECPAESSACLISMFTLNQFSAEAKEELQDWLAEASKSRELWFVYVEVASKDSRFPEVRTVLCNGKRGEDYLLGIGEPHGEWLEWLMKPSQ